MTKLQETKKQWMKTLERRKELKELIQREESYQIEYNQKLEKKYNKKLLSIHLEEKRNNTKILTDNENRQLELNNNDYAALLTSEHENNQYLEIIKNNYYVAWLEENEKKIINTLKKYNGKQLGERTKEKIKEELKKATNDESIYFYKRSYSEYSTVVIKGLNGENREIMEIIITNTENKIEVQDSNIHYCVKKVYVENIQKYLKLLESYKEKMTMHCEELRKLEKEFNDQCITNATTVHFLDIELQIRNAGVRK